MIVLGTFDVTHIVPITDPPVYDPNSFYLEPTHFVTHFRIHEYEDVISKIKFISAFMCIELTYNPTNLFKINASMADDKNLRDINFVFRILQTQSRDFLIVEIQRSDGCAMMFNTLFSKIRRAFGDEALNIDELLHINDAVQHGAEVESVPLNPDEIASEWIHIEGYLETDPISGLKIIGGLGFQGVKIPKSIIVSILSDYSNDIRTNRYVTQIMIAYASDPTSDFTELAIPVLRLFHEVVRQGKIKERYACNMILEIAKNHRTVLLNKNGVPYDRLVDLLRRILIEADWPDTIRTAEFALDALFTN